MIKRHPNLYNLQLVAARGLQLVPVEIIVLGSTYR